MSSILCPDFDHLRNFVMSAHAGFDAKYEVSTVIRMDDRDSRVRFLARTGNFSLHHRVQNGSGAHPASYPMGTKGSFPGGKVAGAWSWPLTPIYCRGQRMSGAIPPLPTTPSWRGAQMKSTGTPLPFIVMRKQVLVFWIVTLRHNPYDHC
jgi:hypothetical protein